MARHYIITIGRSFGSCGREIGEKLSKELGDTFYDRNLILMAAKKSGMKMELLESADEKLLNRFLDPYASMNSTMGTTNDRLFRVQSEIIREIAGRESCVIVGRQADKVLAGYDNCTKIFIYAPLERRVETIMKRHDLNEQEARPSDPSDGQEPEKLLFLFLRRRVGFQGQAKTDDRQQLPGRGRHGEIPGRTDPLEISAPGISGRMGQRCSFVNAGENHNKVCTKTCAKNVRKKM